VARGAFTMIELTVVLLVIGLLVALTAGTVVRVMDSQKKSNTQVTLNKLQSQLTKQWSAYKDLYWKENPAPPVADLSGRARSVGDHRGHRPQPARRV